MLASSRRRRFNNDDSNESLIAVISERLNVPLYELDVLVESCEAVQRIEAAGQIITTTHPHPSPPPAVTLCLRPLPSEQELIIWVVCLLSMSLHEPRA